MTLPRSKTTLAAKTLAEHSFGSGVRAVPGPPALLPLQLLSQELHPVQTLNNQAWGLGEHVLEGHSEQRQDLGVCEPEGGGEAGSEGGGFGEAAGKAGGDGCPSQRVGGADGRAAPAGKRD